MARYYVGTAGWSYEDWEGIVYPESRPRGFHALAYLAQSIDIIEINVTFYRPPSLALTLSWLKKVGPFPDFLFTVKAHQVYTHQRRDFSSKDVDDFLRSIDPLQARGRLAALLFQFPWSFMHTPANTEYLSGLFRLFAASPKAVEVRHASWDRPEFYRFLSEQGVCFCNIDQPVIGKSLKPSAVATIKDFAYVRLHGRNYKDWFREEAGRDDRYNYLYAKDELEDWVQRIKELGQKAGKVYVITNNHYRGQAMANALQIRNMLTGEKLDIPHLLIKKFPMLEEIARRVASGQMDLFKKNTDAPTKG